MPPIPLPRAPARLFVLPHLHGVLPDAQLLLRRRRNDRELRATKYDTYKVHVNIIIFLPFFICFLLVLLICVQFEGMHYALCE